MKQLFAKDIPPRAALSAVALALLASVVIGREKPAEEVVAAAEAQVEPMREPVRQMEAVARKEMVIDLERLKEREMSASTADPFAPPPVEQPPAQAAPGARSVPTPPPLPFTYLGKLVDEGKTAIFVAKGDENYSLTAGQTVAGDYRVEKITESEVTFTYLPMKKSQKLSLIPPQS